MARGVAHRTVGTIDLRHLAPFKCGTLQIMALDPTFQLSESCSGTRAVEKATANEKIKAKTSKWSKYNEAFEVQMRKLAHPATSSLASCSDLELRGCRGDGG